MFMQAAVEVVVVWEVALVSELERVGSSSPSSPPKGTKGGGKTGGGKTPGGRRTPGGGTEFLVRRAKSDEIMIGLLNATPPGPMIQGKGVGIPFDVVVVVIVVGVVKVTYSETVVGMNFVCVSVCDVIGLLS